MVVKLGGDLNRVRRQVIQLLRTGHGDSPAGDVPPPWPRGSMRGNDILARLDSIDSRLAAIERRLGIGPGPAEQEGTQSAPGQPGPPSS